MAIVVVSVVKEIVGRTDKCRSVRHAMAQNMCSRMPRRPVQVKTLLRFSAFATSIVMRDTETPWTAPDRHVPTEAGLPTLKAWMTRQ